MAKKDGTVENSSRSPYHRDEGRVARRDYVDSIMCLVTAVNEMPIYAGLCRLCSARQATTAIACILVIAGENVYRSNH